MLLSLSHTTVILFMLVNLWYEEKVFCIVISYMFVVAHIRARPFDFQGRVGLEKYILVSNFVKNNILVNPGQKKNSDQP